MEIIKQDKSFKRLMRQLFYVPMLHTRWLNDSAKQQLTSKVTEAEVGHRGEIYLVVENNLPVMRSYSLTPRARAIELFGASGVWDTEENTGVLVYVNVCEHDLEIVADRGINAHVEQSVWQSLCDTAIRDIKSGKPIESIGELILAIGDILRTYYLLEDDPSGNELPDRMVHLR